MILYFGALPPILGARVSRNSRWLEITIAGLVPLFDKFGILGKRRLGLIRHGFRIVARDTAHSIIAPQYDNLLGL